MDSDWVPPKPPVTYLIHRAGLKAPDSLYRTFLKRQLPEEGYKFLYEPWIKRRAFLVYKNLIRGNSVRWAFYNRMTKNFTVYISPEDESKK